MPLSANLGFLWSELALPDRIRAAARAGFAAVECHFPYDTPPEETRAALEETSLRMLGLNTRPGDLAAGEFGLCALPGREADARAAIDEAVAYAAAIGCANVHVMAGRSDDRAGAAAVFAANLAHAVARAAPHGIGILIEPINSRNVPGYVLQTIEEAADILDRVGEARIRIMFDCYHLQIMGGDLTTRFRTHMPHVGHVQFAAVPTRAEPDHGEVDYRWLLPEMAASGYTGLFGAEYRPRAGTEAGLGWMPGLSDALTGS